MPAGRGKAGRPYTGDPQRPGEKLKLARGNDTRDWALKEAARGKEDGKDRGSFRQSPMRKAEVFGRASCENVDVGVN